MKIKLLTFDVNGTLFDDTKIFWKAINGIFLKFGKEPMPLKTLQEKFGQPWTKIYREAGIAEIMASDEKLYDIYNELYRSHGNPAIAQGLTETLEWLELMHIPLAIVSTQQNAITIPLLEKYGLSNKFSKISGSVSDKSAALKDLATEMHLPPEQVAYVGDQEGDIRHAKKAGCVSIAFYGGLHDCERLKKMSPDFIIKSMPDLKQLPIF